MFEQGIVNLITVHISGHLKDYTGKKREFVLPSSSIKNVLELIDQLNQIFPGIKERVLDDQDRARPFVNIFVNGENIRDGSGESTKLKDGDMIHILPSVAGG